jgi:hypothetical protein
MVCLFLRICEPSYCIAKDGCCRNQIDEQGLEPVCRDHRFIGGSERRSKALAGHTTIVVVKSELCQ